MKRELASYFDNDRILLVERAFSGLHAIFNSLKRTTSKRKVLFTSTTCLSPVFSALYAGFTPIFTDIRLDDYLMDTEETKARIMAHGDDLAAIVYIYAYGHVTEDVFQLRDLAREKNILFIEDIAQGFGCEVNGTKAGLIGDVAVASFGYSKQIDAGAGGAVLFNSSRMSETQLSEELSGVERMPADVSRLQQDYRHEFYEIRARAMEDPRIYRHYSHFPNKYKALYFRERTVDWEAVARKLRRFIDAHEVKTRLGKAEQYQALLRAVVTDGKINHPFLHPGSSIYRYTIHLTSRDDARKLSQTLRNAGIHCSNLYIPISRIYNDSGFERAVYFAERVINLWVDHVADDDYIKHTCRIIEQYFRSREQGKEPNQ